MWRYFVVIASACAVLLGACGDAPSRTLTHDAYIWQYVWREPLKQAVLDSAPLVRTWHVLAAEIDAKGQLRTIAVDFATLKTAGRPVVPVIRIEGNKLSKTAAAQIAAVVRPWQAEMAIAGVQIDHDSRESLLSDYARALSALRAELVPRVPLSITLLPDWLDAPDFRALLRAVDETVLQLHSIPSAGQSTFDLPDARQWVRRMNRMGTPFRIALPNYGSRVYRDALEKIVAIESEGPAVPTSAQGTEVFSPPQLLAQFMDELRREPPSNLRGIVWFRLPVDGDVRVWSRSTWHAVLQSQDLSAQIDAAAVPDSSRPGALKLLLLNSGKIDAPLPARVSVNMDCKHALSDGYVAQEPNPDAPMQTVFVRKSRALMRAGSTMVVAQLVCPGDERHIQAYVEH